MELEAPKVRLPVNAVLPDDPNFQRVQMTASCRDCDGLSRVEHAGDCFDDDRGSYQLMHNGVKVVKHGYHGGWMAEVIRRLKGHHEPQEERVFHKILEQLPPKATMLELGGFWAYYSLWFHHSIEEATNYIIEPDPSNIEVGRKNFALNDYNASFTQAAIGSHSLPSVSFGCESDNVERSIRQTCVDDFVRENEIGLLDVLHADIQGAELDMLAGARWCIEQQKIRFIFVSTHHHSISGDPLTHQRCCKALSEAGAHILAEHTVAESFSGDGLIVASFDPRDREMKRVTVSHNRASTSLFPETEYDLAEALAEIRRLKLHDQTSD